MKCTPLLFVLLFLSACGPQRNGGTDVSLDHLLQNPLYQERYAEELVERMVSLIIQEDPLLEDSGKAAIAEDTRAKWLEISQEARKLQRQGLIGNLLPMKEYAFGEVLYLNDTVFLGTTFETVPGPELHLYISGTLDPRDAEFPDLTAVDLGLLESPYGAQQYAVPSMDTPQQYRTVVLWDKKLGRLYGFAQLSK